MIRLQREVKRTAIHTQHPELVVHIVREEQRVGRIIDLRPGEEVAHAGVEHVEDSPDELLLSVDSPVARDVGEGVGDDVGCVSGGAAFVVGRGMAGAFFGEDVFRVVDAGDDAAVAVAAFDCGGEAAVAGRGALAGGCEGG